MDYFFCFLSAEEAKNPINYGFNYALSKESEWVKFNESENHLTGVIKGIDFFVKDGKTYNFYKRFLDIDNKRLVCVCIESLSGCDTKTF